MVVFHPSASIPAHKIRELGKYIQALPGLGQEGVVWAGRSFSEILTSWSTKGFLVYLGKPRFPGINGISETSDWS